MARLALEAKTAACETLLPRLPRRSATFALLMLSLLFAFPLSSHAQGLVWNAAPPGDAGWQVEADRISPAPPSLAPATDQAAAPAAATKYVVQSGDTLGAIAQKLGVDEAALAAANRLASPDQIKAGQALTVTTAVSPTLAALAPAGLDRLAATPLAYVRFYPWPPVQGKVVTLWWRAEAPISLTLRAGGQSYPVAGSGMDGWAFLPFDALAQPGQQPLTLSGSQVVSSAWPFSVTLQVSITAGDFAQDDVPAETADPILADARKVAEEAQKVTGLFARETPSGWRPSDRFRLPLPEDGLHTSPFGTRRVYGSGGGLTYHAGEDFGIAPGTPVLAPADGLVVLAETLFVRGNAVIIDHGHGVITGYWHMQKLDVKAGDRVKAGDQLGEVGTTGLSTGPHLHWELRVHGVAADPLEWLR